MAVVTNAKEKIKLLDQLLEDLAGDEFDEFDDNNMSSGIKRFDADMDLTDIDNLH